MRDNAYSSYATHIREQFKGYVSKEKGQEGVRVEVIGLETVCKEKMKFT